MIWFLWNFLPDSQIRISKAGYDEMFACQPTDKGFVALKWTSDLES